MKKPPKKELLCCNLQQIATQYQVTERTARRWLAKDSLYKKKTGYGPSKLSMEKAVEIRSLYYTEQYTQFQLAKIYNVSQTTICRIINNEIYKVDLRIKGSAIDEAYYST